MTRRAALVTSIILASATLAALVTTSLAVTVTSASAPAPATASATASAPAPAPATASAPASAAPVHLCPSPAGAAASAAATRVDRTDLPALSALAFALERAAERHRAGPALPPRMGHDAITTAPPCYPLP